MITKALLSLTLLCAAASAQAAPSASPWTTRRPNVPSGQVEGFLVPSKLYDHPRQVWVYTPAGYDAQRPVPYGVVVCFDGADYGDGQDIPLPTILDNLTAAGKLPPVVALLIDNGSGRFRIGELGNGALFARALSEEMMPWLRAKWHVTSDPQRVIVTGSSAGGLGAAYVAYRHPELFGNVLSQSGAFWRGNEGSNDPPYEWLAQQFKDSPKLPLRFYLEVGELERAHAVGTGPVFIEANRHLRDVLRGKGYPLFYKEVPGAHHEPEHWKNELPGGLMWLTAAWMRRP